MFIVWIVLVLQSSWAESTQSIALQARTFPSSLGFQRYHTGLGIHHQNCHSTDSLELNNCWRIKGGWGQRRDQIPTGSLRTHTLNIELQRGLLIPGDLLDIGFFSGFGITNMIGGVDTLAVHTLPQIHGEIHIQHTTPKELTIWISGQSILYWPTMGNQVQVGWEIPW